jgi:hypothetical protein
MPIRVCKDAMEPAVRLMFLTVVPITTAQKLLCHDLISKALVDEVYTQSGNLFTFMNNNRYRIFIGVKHKVYRNLGLPRRSE